MSEPVSTLTARIEEAKSGLEVLLSWVPDLDRRGQGFGHLDFLAELAGRAEREMREGQTGRVCADGLHYFQTDICDCGKQANHSVRAESREGMVTVYDHFGRYVGCMGEETWRAALASFVPQTGNDET